MTCHRIETDLNHAEIYGLVFDLAILHLLPLSSASTSTATLHCAATVVSSALTLGCKIPAVSCFLWLFDYREKNRNN